MHPSPGASVKGPFQSSLSIQSRSDLVKRSKLYNPKTPADNASEGTVIRAQILPSREAKRLADTTKVASGTQNCFCAAVNFMAASVDFQCRLIEAASVNLWVLHLHHAHRPIHISGRRHAFRVLRFVPAGLRGFAHPHVEGAASSRAGMEIEFVARAVPMSGDRSARFPSC